MSTSREQYAAFLHQFSGEFWKEETVRRLQEIQEGLSKFFYIPSVFLKDLRPAEAILLAFIFNHLDPLARGQRWVRLTTRDVQEKLPAWPKLKVLRALSSLRDRGLLKVRLRGRERQVRLREKSNGYQNDTDSPTNYRGGLTPLKGVYPSHPTEKKKQHTVHVRSMRPKVPVHCPDCESTDWRELGEKLRTTLSKVTTVPKTAKPGQWGAQIRAAHVRDEVPLSHLLEILHWYCKLLPVEGDINTNGNPNCIPVCYSGKAVREKFGKLEGAHARIKREGGGEGPKLNVRMRVVKRSKSTRKVDEWGF